MNNLSSLNVFESLASASKTPVIAGEPLPNDTLCHGVVLLDFDIDHFFESSISGHFSLMFNELGLPSGNADDIYVLSSSECDFHDLACKARKGRVRILYDFNGKLNSALPFGAITYDKRGAFENDAALEWRYTGDPSAVHPARLKVFMMAARGSFEFVFMRNVFGHVEVQNLMQLGDELYDRAKAVFDAFMIGFAEFPMDKEQVDDFAAYMHVLGKHPDAVPRPLTSSAKIVPVDENVRGYGKKLIEAGKLCRSAQELWEEYSRASGAGMPSLTDFSHMLLSSVKMPLNTDTRKEIAAAIGVESAINALASGVPMQDILA